MVAVMGHVGPLSHPTPGCALVARVPFDYGAHRFKAGDDVSREKLDITEHKVMELWLAGMIVPKPAATVPSPTKRKAG